MLPPDFDAACTGRAWRRWSADSEMAEGRCLLSTREDEAFLCINGIQTQSARTVNLLGEIDHFTGLGVDVLRISPQSQHTIEIIERFSAVVNDPRSPTRFNAELLNWKAGCQPQYVMVTGTTMPAWNNTSLRIVSG